MTGNPSSRAVALTGLGVSLRPRPVGASGRVMDADHIKTWIGGKGLERGHRYIGGAGEHEFEHGPP